MVDISGLNAEQREAVLDFDHSLLILACAGSGKTRTITAKIAYAIEKGIYKPYQILAVTFTNKAALEMRERVEQYLPDTDLTGLEMRTFHSFGAYLLRTNAARAKLAPSFCIYDDKDSLSLLTAASPELDKKYLRQVYKQIAKVKDLGLKPWDRDIDQYFDGNSQIYMKYQSALDKTGNADFADLIIKPTEMLRDNPDLRAHYQDRFRLVLVDEYQDSNRMQFEFLRMLAGPGTKLVAVGDDDQSIYSFRGADISNILTFADSFENVREIKLEKNYRSTSQILSAASALIRNNRERHQKSIISAYESNGARPQLLVSHDGHDESYRIASIIRETGNFSGTAVLYRTNAQSLLFEQAFTDMKIPYKLVGSLRFYDREEVKDSLSLLYLLLNHRDEISFRRVINKPARGIGEQKVMRILSQSEDIMEGLRIFAEGGGTGSTGAMRFYLAWKTAEEALDKEDNLGDIFRAALLSSGLYEYYESEPDRAIRDAKTDNIGQVVSLLQEAGSGRDDLIAFLEKVTLDASAMGEDPAADGVTLITMHNTKGLEYDRVFVAGLEESLIPGRNTQPRNLEEERRILYVAMTRARKSLYLSYAKRRALWGMVDYQIPSRFLSEIPADLIATEVREKPRTVIENRPQWSSLIPDKPKVRKVAPRNKDGYFSAGDAVRSKDFGRGIIEDIVEKSPGRRVLTVRFGKKTAKYIEAFADLERIES